MITMDAPAVLTAQDLLRYEGEGDVEFAHGQIWEKPASVESAEVEVTISTLLRVEAKKTGEARVFSSTLGYRCFPEEPLRFRKPDVSLVRSERLKGVAADQGFVTIPPDLAVEVLSPNDLAYEVDEKVEEYLSNGFRLIWIVYPNTRKVVVHRADRTMATLYAQDQITGESALPSFACRVADFFPEVG